MIDTIANVACTRCACVCDDVTLTIRDGCIDQIAPGCSLAEPWFAEQSRQPEELVTVDGQPVLREAAIARAVDILRTAKSPLIYGLSRSSTPGQRAAIALADRLRAMIDTTASEGHAPSILALQQVGESTCSLGEVRNRADLVMYWGSNPIVSHPRHMSRYSVEPTGHQIPNGRSDRRLVVVDVKETETAAVADEFLPLRDGGDLDAILALRAELQGQHLDVEATTGWSREQVARLADHLKTCRYGIVFFGYGLVHQPNGHLLVEQLLRLVTELNAFTRFAARRMRVVGDVSGADSVLAWQTGYPFSVSFARGFPRYSPGEFSAGPALARHDVDAVILVGSERLETFPPAAQERLRDVPTILLDGPTATPDFEPTVRLTTATYGIHHRGTAYRMDEVPIPLAAPLANDLPTDADILRAILAEFGD
jgi:formylmethanofuran dehydrogenase subunit B